MAVGDRTSLNTLFCLLRDNLKAHGAEETAQPFYREFRDGDVRHSQAATEKATRLLGYACTHRMAEGIEQASPWYAKQVLSRESGRQGSVADVH